MNADHIQPSTSTVRCSCNNAAIGKCKRCGLLCQNCADGHPAHNGERQTSIGGHLFRRFEPQDADCASAPKKKITLEMCDEHPSHIVRQYCVDCSRACCPACGVEHHSGHNGMELEQYAVQCREVLQTGLTKATLYLEDQNFSPDIHKVKTEMDNCRKTVKQTAFDLRHAIDKQEKEFLQRFDKLEKMLNNIIEQNKVVYAHQRLQLDNHRKQVEAMLKSSEPAELCNDRPSLELQLDLIINQQIIIHHIDLRKTFRKNLDFLRLFGIVSFVSDNPECSYGLEMGSSPRGALPAPAPTDSADEDNNDDDHFNDNILPGVNVCNHILAFSLVKLSE